MTGTISTSSSAQQSLHYSLLSAFLKGTAKVPQMPENSLRIRSLLKDPYISLEQLSRVINRDPPLAAYLMQFADSPLIKSARPCRSLTDVLARLGTNQLSNLVLAFSVRHMFISKELPLQKVFRARWNASSIRAAWSACLAPLVRGISTDDALLGGLFQDIGSLPLLAELENWPQISRDSETLNELCEQISAPIGTILLTTWKQPSSIIDCARYRSNHTEAPTATTTQLYEVVQMGEALQNPNKHQTLAQLPLAQQIFTNLDANEIQQQLKEQVNLWFLLLGVKTRIR
ncbi:HDOD domain-containing protein [Pseudomonas sp. C27(2019)]|uniref:HDOD domain-containing protein n=1 Tax=Pseudomonas sp. C27(2019) TaxID=2604941 RepID=UPI0012455CD4|nr:HDOD domain-containing protein [Pseudomonas sp. C27(2019)]QEY59165.1 HDOD domain-containing protein [Pseudomonas sp. C27(2019)]